MFRLKFNKVNQSRQIKEVKKLADEIWSEHFTAIIGQPQVRYMLDKFQSERAIADQISHKTDYYLITGQHANSGYLAIKISGQTLFLSKLYLLSSERGKGYARQSIQFLQQIALEKGVDTISLTVNKDNLSTIKVYQRLGFVIKGTHVKDIGNGFFMDDYLMELKV